MYDVILDSDALEFLEKADKKLAKRIWDKIMSTKPEPHHFFEKLTGRQDHKLRIGDYRAIADIQDTTKIIEITLIGHRKNIYKKT
ncbi:MAG: type II toxin-antitoxin system RelE/ParE family toxin [Candidatus Altiarchaeota archaeon]